MKEDFDPEQGKRIVHPKEITDRMAKLFFSFFWGRTDVYAKRNVNKNGEAAYYPQCDNFWSDNCHRKLNTHIDCKDCKYCSYTRLDLSTILMHLRGNSYAAKDVIGVYPLFSDETCRFLVFDFDNHEKNAEKRDFANTDDTWIEEVEAMRDICTLNGIEPLVERSRSGRGAHIWIFFDKPISAALVRKFGFALLDKGAEQVNLKSFNYYDRMLPAQDSLENVAIGNLIALPLQGRALKDGNSAFVDSNWNAYPDQWNALLSKPKLSEEFLENKIREWIFTADELEASSDEENREKPWDRMKNFAKSDVDGKMDIILSNGIYVDSTNLKPAMQNKIRRMAAFSNPVFYKNRAIGTSNYDTSRWIYLGKDHLGGYIQIPRGLQDELIANIDKAGIEYTIDDERQQGRNINVEFNGELRPEQNKALKELTKHDNGILHAACKQYYNTRYVRLPDLLIDLEMARTDGTYRKVMAKYANPLVLILDEWLLLKPTEVEQKDIFELLYRRRKKSSTIFCSQYGFEEWYDQLGGDASPLADAIVDRIAHDSYRVNITSIDEEHDISMREVYGLDKALRE